MNKNYLKLILLLSLCLLAAAPLSSLAAQSALAQTTKDSATAAQTGWVQKKYRYYYSDNGIPLRNTMKKINGKRYYFNSKGRMATNVWKTIKGRRMYFTSNGTAAVGLVKIGSKNYLFSESGLRMTQGLRTWKSKTYYLNKYGVPKTGWQLIKSKWHFFNKKGVMQTGWQTLSGKVYYLNGKGIMLTGWQKIKSGKKSYSYYFHPDGSRAENQWIDGKYVGSNGKQQKNNTQPISILEDSLTSFINNSCTSGQWSIYVKNLDDGQSLLINNDYIYAASLIKVFAMGAVYESIHNGLIPETPAINQSLNAMITYSSNDDFNSLIRTIGINTTNSFCKKYGYTDTNQGQGINPSSNNYGLDNGTTWNQTSVQNCGLILEDIYRGKCISKAYSQNMLNLLGQQHLRHKIPSGVPSGNVYSKTGETDEYEHDIAIVESPKANYILCVMSKISNTGAAQGNIRSISNIVYNHFN